MTATCVVCGCNNIEDAGTISRQSYTKQGIKTVEIPVGICAGCGFLFMWPVPSDREFIKVHQNVYYPNWGDNQSIVAHAQKVYDFISESIPLEKCGSVLDIGCGEGKLLEIFHDMGVNSFGIEIRQEINLDRLRKKNIFIYSTPFQDIDFSRRFDLVVMDNVLEHIPTPSSVLTKISNLLSPQGYLVVSVPYLTESCDGVFIPEHVNYFTPTSVENLCRAYGFDVVTPPHHENEISIYKISQNEQRGVIENDYAYARHTISKYMESKMIRDSLIKNNLQMKLNALIEQGHSVVFYGAGSFALYILELLDLNHEQFLGFVDSNPLKRGQYIHNHLIHGLDELHSLNPNAVFICTDNCHFISEIKQQIANLLPNNVCEIISMNDITGSRKW